MTSQGFLILPRQDSEDQTWEMFLVTVHLRQNCQLGPREKVQAVKPVVRGAHIRQIVFSLTWFFSSLGFQPPLKQWVEKYNHHC